MIMKKFSILALILLLGTSHAFPIDTDANCENMNFKPFFAIYGNNKVSTISAGRGYTGIAALGNISQTNLNPASLQIENNAQAYYEYGTKNESVIHEDTNYEHDMAIFRAGTCYGAAYNVNDQLQVGVIYSKLSSHEADMGTVYNYDTSNIVIETIDLWEKVAHSVFSIPVSYKFSDKLRIGIGLDSHLYHANTSRACINSILEYENFKGEIDFILFRPKLGAIAKLGNNFSVGATFVPPTEKRIKEEVCWEEICYDRNSFPLEFGLGTQYQFSKIPLTVLADYSYTNEAINVEFKDRHNLNVGLEGNITSFMQLRAGYSYESDIRDLDHLEADGDEFWGNTHSYEMNYLSAGASIKWKATTWDLAVMNSGVLSDFDNTYIKLGCTLDLENN
jgi:long-subunit fatty acid transport protein